LAKNISGEAGASGLNKTADSDPSRPEAAGAAASLARPAARKAAGAGDKSASLRFAGEPLLLADDSRNIILIRALTPDYTRLVKLLERLDNLPRQVLIEVLVAEVRLSDSWEFGIEWALKNNKLKINDSQYRQEINTNFANVAAAGEKVYGVAYSIFNSSDQIVGLLNALASETDVSLLSSPQVLVLNNEEATVNVGDQVPIVTTETERVGVDTPTYDKTVQYKDTGTILKVTPRINYDGVIILDINQQVSQATTNETSGINSPVISTRELKTKLAVKDGQSIMMGGLISKDNNNTESKVPILGDIPLLGWMFKYQKESAAKTELLVMITPYVIESDDVLDQYVKKFQEKMAGLRKEITEKPKVKSNSEE
jgi:general secretion pathway protein D